MEIEVGEGWNNIDSVMEVNDKKVEEHGMIKIRV